MYAYLAFLNIFIFTHGRRVMKYSSLAGDEKKFFHRIFRHPDDLALSGAVLLRLHSRLMAVPAGYAA
jgi:hypothetical protein